MKRITGIILITITAILIVWDIITGAMNNHSTISELITTLSTRYPIIPFGFGILMGHFFWQVDYKK
jgi:hypothetical protein